MNKATCEKLVDAYGLAVELYAENERRDNYKMTTDIGELCDNLREVLAELSSSTTYFPIHVNAPSWDKVDLTPKVTWSTESAVTRPLSEVRA